jgi:mannose-6-phosphate isomerase-like protein (cupin superfamily)
MSAETDRGYVVVVPDDLRDSYADSNVPGEFRRLTEALGGNQLAVTLIRIPAHSDFEQGTGHHHEEIEEIYIVTRGTLTMRFSDEIETVPAPAAVRVAPGTVRSHRNEGDEDVEVWAISQQLGRSDSTKVDDFWDASPHASQTSD